MFGRKRPRPTVPSTPTPPPIGDPSPMIPSTPIRLISGVNPIGMSYWRNINYHAGRPNLLAALAVNDQIRILTIDKSNLSVIDDKSLGIHHTGEGIFFSSTRHDVLYVPLDDALIAVNVFDGSRSVIWQSGNKLWQIHANWDENIFSATIRNNNYKSIAWGVYQNGNEKHFPINGTPDECQIDKSGKWLLVKEDNYNRIIRLSDGSEAIIQNEAGALGHSDNGFECAVGENDFSDSPGALDMITFGNMEKRFMYSTGIWNMGYAATNGRGIVLVTTPDALVKVNFDWPHEATVVCPNLTQSQEYEDRPKANICPLNEYAIWTAFVDGDLSAFAVRLP